jgi:hypothetical protein
MRLTVAEPQQSVPREKSPAIRDYPVYQRSLKPAEENREFPMDWHTPTLNAQRSHPMAPRFSAILSVAFIARSSPSEET